ncbi:histone-like nucleoid-structuring protein Lsr2 [Nonomuraea polychroma]|uniref:histone-like nucleoid-structuring protein Lsr2 n=1 Tax=Nonomuraea polychroma TaxID=46176 RepID=UPI003D90B514
MAKQIREILIDDLDGGEANETIAFAIDGSSYEIDLSDPNAKNLRDALTPFVQNARRASGGPTRRRSAQGRQRAMSREKSSEIRQWAKAHGLPVSERGRIAGTVVQKYEDAH